MVKYDDPDAEGYRDPQELKDFDSEWSSKTKGCIAPSMQAILDQAMSCMAVHEKAMPEKARLDQAMSPMAVPVKASHS